MSWTVHVYDEAAKQLKTIPPDRRTRILEDIFAMRGNPFQGLVKPLRGKKYKGIFRKVSGRYRIIFKPIHATSLIVVLAILPRNESTYK